MVTEPKYIGVKQAADKAVRRSQDYFRRTQDPAGYWWGELESTATMDAEGGMADDGEMDRNRALEAVRVTEAGALAASRLMGRGDEKEG